MPLIQNNKTENRNNVVTNSIKDFKNGPHKKYFKKWVIKMINPRGGMGKKMKEEHRTGRERDIYNKIADLNKNVSVIMLNVSELNSPPLFWSIYLFVFRFFSHIDYNRVLSRVPGAIQSVLVGYLSLYVDPNLIYSPIPFTFSNHKFVF